MALTLSTEIAMPPFATVQQLSTVPNMVTLVRVGGILPFIVLSAAAQQEGATGARWATLLLYGGIAGSDILDGWLARRLGQTSALGRILDHGSDAGFILAALGAYAGRGLVPWWLPAAIACAFGLYVLDSWWRTAAQPQRRLLGSRVGHLGGILYYCTVGIVTVQICTASRWLSPHLLQVWYAGMTLLALLSCAERLFLLTQARRTRPH
jgi:phosphatidylglycerophosphate synthase